MKSFQYIKTESRWGKKTSHVCLICNVWEDGGDASKRALPMQLIQKDGRCVCGESPDGQLGDLGLNLQDTEACFPARSQGPSPALRPLLAESHSHLHTSTNYAP